MSHPSYSCLHVLFCIASMRSTHKKSIEKQITLANLYSARAKRSCMYSVCRGGKPAPQAGTGVRGLATHVFNNLSTASELQRYSQSLLHKNKPSQTNRRSLVKHRIALIAGGHICTNNLDCHRQPLSNFIHVHVLRKEECRSRLVQRGARPRKHIQYMYGLSIRNQLPNVNRSDSVTRETPSFYRSKWSGADLVSFLGLKFGPRVQGP